MMGPGFADGIGTGMIASLLLWTVGVFLVGVVCGWAILC